MGKDGMGGSSGGPIEDEKFYIRIRKPHKILNPDYISLLKIKTDILMIKADDYHWQCNVPKDVKLELDSVLEDVNNQLTYLKS